MAQGDAGAQIVHHLLQSTQSSSPQQQKESNAFVNAFILTAEAWGPLELALRTTCSAPHVDSTAVFLVANALLAKVRVAGGAFFVAYTSTCSPTGAARLDTAWHF